MLKTIERIKNEILGREYELSFAFVSKNKIKELNKKYRQKDEPTDVLSFPLSKSSGEIVICKEIANKKFRELNSDLFNYLQLTTNHYLLADYLLFLSIHGLLHLKGLKHGAKMEKLEKEYFQKFK